MASLSNKKITKSNAVALKELHCLSCIINAVAIICHFLFSRPVSIKPYVFLSIPAAISQYLLESWGRASQIGNPKRSVDDIKGPGLYEYMFDCIYVTWACTLLMTLTGSNKAWLVYLFIPGFVFFKIFSLLKGLRHFGKSKERTSSKNEVKNEEGKKPKSSRRRRAQIL